MRNGSSFKELVTRLLSGLFVIGAAFPAIADEAQAGKIERGRYLSVIAGCNDCHTAGYLLSGGQIPETEWFKGDAFGWNGPWGTTYAPNLRISLSKMTEDQWVSFAQNLKTRPPMPSFNLNKVTEEDLRALYAFVSQLQPLGDPAPEYLPPGVEPTGPYAKFPAPPPE